MFKRKASSVGGAEKHWDLKSGGAGNAFGLHNMLGGKGTLSLS